MTRDDARRPAASGLLILALLALLPRPVAAEAPGKLPVPDAAAQEAARKLVAEVYGGQYTRAKTPEEKTALARKMILDAPPAETDAAGCFVMLRIAREAASGAGDLATALEAVDKLGEHFQVDVPAMKLSALKAAAAGARSSAQQAALAKAALELMDEAADEERFEAALEIGEAGAGAARRGKALDLAKRIAARQAEIGAQQAAWAEAEKARTKLETAPADPEANLTLGRYLCFARGDWAGGLSKLALGSDEKLKPLAVAELKKPETPDEQVALADGWWDLAQAREGAEKTALLLRAGTWYDAVHPSLGAGLVQAKVQKRLKEIAALGEALPPVAGPASDVVPGADSLPVGEVRRFGTDGGAARCLALSHDGRLLLAGLDAGEVAVWNVATGEEVLRKTLGGAAYCAAFSRDGRLAAVGSTQPVFRVLDLETREVVREVHVGNGVTCMAFAHDGARMLVGAETHAPFRIWEIKTGRELAKMPVGGNIRSMSVSPDGKLVVGGFADGNLICCETAQGKHVRTIKAHAGTVLAAAFLPDNRHAVSGGDDKAIRQWDLATGAAVRQFDGHEAAVTGVSVSADGRWLASSAKDGAVRLWNLRTGKPAGTWKQEGAAGGVTFLPDPRFIVLIGGGQVRLWKLPVPKPR